MGNKLGNKSSKSKNNKSNKISKKEDKKYDNLGKEIKIQEYKISKNEDKKYDNLEKEIKIQENKIPKNEDKKYYDLKLRIKVGEYEEKCQIDPMILLKRTASFACGLEDGTIKLFSVKSPYSLQIEMRIHSTAVNCIFETKIGELISGADFPDSTIKLISFNLEDKVFEIIKTIKGHKSNVYNAIQLEKKFSSELYASCSEDKTIKIWNKDSGQAMLVYKNIELIWCILELSNYRIIFCQSEKFHGLFEINYKTGTIKKKNDKIRATGSNGLYKMKIDNKNYIAIASYKEIFIVDDIDFRIKNNFKFDVNNFFWSIKLLSDNSFIINGADKNIYQVSVDDGQLISKVEIHMGSIPSIIELENNILVTCSYDHKIKFWKLKK